MAIYTPNEYVRALCAAGPVGVAVISAVLGSIIIVSRWKAGPRSLWVAATAFALNVLFIASVLVAFALELLRAFPFRSAP